MSASRVLGLHLSRATGRPALSRWAGTRPTVSRRGYASSHGKPSSDTTWLITSVAVSLPIGFYIWRQGPGRPKPPDSVHGSHKEHGKEHGEGHGEEPKEDLKDGPKAEPKKEPKEKGGDEKSKSGKSGESSGGPTKEMDDNQENQAAKLTDKPASKRVDPTET
ncbi:hypothetical protein QBC34DRAFT_46932 [Podospora aff. communis PSN243]|uniref:Uncharacterized protein n=1 Tax=Podospora aff. communis PSN243 TaxID=3040156 RepID=A0AAV9GT86_9PEZI|nr:hypothetical protein QBC34DRAFT_46932 [Podospora aff. communis PSN243]